jgi:hypothetical protein
MSTPSARKVESYVRIVMRRGSASRTDSVLSTMERRATFERKEKRTSILGLDGRFAFAYFAQFV